MGAKAREHKYSDAPCEIALVPSRSAPWIIGSAALATLALLAAAPGLVPLRILAGTWVACASIEAIHSRALLRGRRAVRALRLSRDGEIELQDALGRWHEGIVEQGSFVAPWLTIVRWRGAGARFARTLPILPDMVPEEDFRRVRVMLRWS